VGVGNFRHYRIVENIWDLRLSFQLDKRVFVLIYILSTFSTGFITYGTPNRALKSTLPFDPSGP
jgi:hypothetical protein